MEIILAETAGFCFGVKRAVECVYQKIDEGKKIYTYGPIIHNKTVTNDLKSKGVEIVHDLDELDDSFDGLLIIRSHGVGADVYRRLDKQNINYIDCTCPFVQKIHKIVNRSYHEEDKKIIIVGNKDHPEVIGINGWCDNIAIITDNENISDISFDFGEKYVLVVQTTFEKDNLVKILDKLPKGLDVNLHNTICNATTERQSEISEIAKKADKIIVLGDSKSSNTQKLYNISKNINKNTYKCETIKDLSLKNLSKNDKIGISAGASTPPAIIKEAITQMSEMENFAEMLDQSMVTLRNNEVVKGTVIKVTQEEVSVNLGYKSDGIITKSEFSEDPEVNLTEELKAGDEIDVYVLKVNDGDGNVLLSKKRLEATKGYEELEEVFNNKAVVSGKVVEIIKGGLMVKINGVKVFCPSSQISNRFVENLSDFKGKEFDFNIIEFDKSKRRIIAGRKELAQKEFLKNRAKVLEGLSAGEKLEGVVSRIVDFGAFVNINGVDGLIHISEMSWGRVKKVTDVLSVGDKVEVYILEVDAEKGKISLSLKDVNKNPWLTVVERYPIGEVVTGKVVRMVPFGAFVELEEGVDGLVHVSQISRKHVAKPEDVLSVGQEISAKVTDVDSESKKISLSIKDTDDSPEEDASEEIENTSDNTVEE